MERRQRRRQLSAKLTTTLTTLLCNWAGAFLILAVLVVNKGLVSNGGRQQELSEEPAASAVD